MIKILDHGYLQYVEHWGSDERIIEAARQSTQKGFEGWGPTGWKCDAASRVASPDPCTWQYPYSSGANINPFKECPRCSGPVVPIQGDEKLLAYLWKNNHATPFEMGGMTIEVQAPIFVFREWHRHRTQSYNEMSARYAPLPDINYIPTLDRLMIGGGHLTKQAAGTGAALTLPAAHSFIDNLPEIYARLQEVYEHALNVGVPKELARIVLPVGRYSRMRASANLRNWLGFLTLRMDKNAQWEIRQYANCLHDMLKEKFPRTLALFDKEV